MWSRGEARLLDLWRLRQHLEVVQEGKETVLHSKLGTMQEGLLFAVHPIIFSDVFV
jgi:hypothetical protein